MDDVRERWRIALHESAHAIGALAQGGEVGCVAISDGGMCRAECSTTTAMIFMVGCGPAAESLLADIPPPAEVPMQVRKSAPEAKLHDDRLALAARATSPDKDCLSDARRIAEFAITGCENEPERWASRVAWVHHVAYRIVSDNQQAIIKLATALFHKRFMFNEEIQEALAEGEKNVC